MSILLIKPTLLLAGLSALTACPLLDVEVEVPEVCLAYADLQVDGVPGDPAPSTHHSFSIDDLSGFHPITDLDADVAFLRAEVLARSGIADFGFVGAVRITIQSGDDSSTLPPLVLYQCDGDCATGGGALDLPAAAEHDVLDYLRGESLIVDLELSGPAPRDDWSMSISVCFAARARYTY